MAGMQTRPLLSSEPATVERNGWTNPVIVLVTPCPRVPFAAGWSAVGQAGYAEPFGTVWDSMGQNVPSNQKPSYLRGLASVVNFFAPYRWSRGERLTNTVRMQSDP